MRRTAANSAVRSTLIRLSVLLVFFPLIASHGVSADSPVLDTFNQWLSAFNSGDESKISGFWKTHASPGLPANRFALDLRLRKATGGMEIFRIMDETQMHFAAVMREARGVYSESIMDLVSVNPPLVGRLIGRPVPPPNSYSSQASDDADLITKVRDEMNQMHGANAFSGAILIGHHGKILLSQAWGDADIAKNLRNTPNTQFSIASMNKMFTAVSVLELVSRGKLALDAPIARYWSDYPNQDLAARVTIRELLDHTAGTGDIFVPEVQTHRSELHTLADVVRLLGNRPLEFQPGIQWEYSNYGFILLGRLIEIVSGEPYDKYVREHVFLPVGMLHTTPRPDTNNPGSYAIGYTHSPAGLAPTTPAKPEPPVAGATAAGGGYSTVHDLFLFAQALQAGTLLNPSLLKQATTWDVVHPQCGLGFSLVWDHAYGHEGAGAGVNGELRILPERGYVLIALSNRDPMMAANMLDAITFTLPPAWVRSVNKHVQVDGRVAEP